MFVAKFVSVVLVLDRCRKFILNSVVDKVVSPDLVLIFYRNWSSNRARK